MEQLRLELYKGLKSIKAGLKVSEIKMLKILSKTLNKKDFDKKIIDEIIESITSIEMSLNILEKTKKTIEPKVKDRAIKSSGEIYITIDDYMFVKNECKQNYITIYLIHSDGFYEFIHGLIITNELNKTLNNIKSFENYVKDWYMENECNLNMYREDFSDYYDEKE
jgi:hypothetical protein